MSGKRFQVAWDGVRTSLWLLPLLMVAAGAGLAGAMLAVDAGAGAEDALRVWWMNAGGAEDARELLSTLLSGVVAMAAMAFSSAVVVLTLAASQYGPRLVRVFRADRGTQAALGTFAGTIVYLVLVLRTVHGDAEFHDVPHAATSLGTALALACVLALLAFIQEVARVAVADDVVARVGRELDTAVESLPLLDEEDAAEPPAVETEAAFWDGVCGVTQRREGYVQAIDHAGLLAWAERNDAVLRLDFRAGDFVVAGDRRILVRPRAALRAAEAEGICEHAVTGRERTPTQDLEFSVRHLVEVAVRALSPGVNDPFTAIVVIDRLRGCLTRLTGRRLPLPVLRDASGRVRLVRETTNFGGVMDAALHQIRQAGAGHPAVVIHMLEALARIAEHARRPEQREAIARHVRMVAAAGLREAAEPGDRGDIERSVARAERALRAEERPATPRRGRTAPLPAALGPAEEAPGG